MSGMAMEQEGASAGNMALECMDKGTGSEPLCQISIQARIGELVQGHSPRLGRVLVSGPLSRSMATTTSLYGGRDPSIRLCGTAQRSHRLPGVDQGSGTVPGFVARFGSKTLRALQAFFLSLDGITPEALAALPPDGWDEQSHWRLEEFFDQFHLRRVGNIPVGKGFSSSSADVLGLLTLLDRHFASHLGKERLYGIAATIEPTDPLLDGGMLLFDSGRGRILRPLPPLDLAILYFDSDPHGAVETTRDEAPGLSERLSFHSASGDFDPVDAMVSGFLEAWDSADVSAIFREMTKSALGAHARRRRPGMESLREFAHKIGAGLFVAHTGTLMGMVVPPDRVTEIFPEAQDFVKGVWGVPVELETTPGSFFPVRDSVSGASV